MKRSVLHLSWNELAKALRLLPGIRIVAGETVLSSNCLRLLIEDPDRPADPPPHPIMAHLNVLPVPEVQLSEVQMGRSDSS